MKKQVEIQIEGESTSFGVISVAFTMVLRYSTYLFLLIALGGMISGVAHGQGLRMTSYQGVLEDGVTTANGSYTFAINYYDTSGRSVYSETFNNVTVRNGIFSLTLGSGNGGFPSSMSFNEQYQIGISINGGAEMTPRTSLLSSAYAINAGSVNGIPASSSPQPGALYPLDATGKIDPKVLPQVSGSVLTINNVTPDAGGNVLVIPSTHMQIVNDAALHSLTLSSSGIQLIEAGQGLVGGGSSDTVPLSVGLGAITSANIANGAITGNKIAYGVAGQGLYQDGLGDLNVAADNVTLEVNNGVVRIKDGGVSTQEMSNGSVTSSKIAEGAVGTMQIDPTQVQTRVSGAPIGGFFVQSINQDGSVNGATVWTNGTLTRTVVGNDLSLGLALYNPNNWTGLQNFSGGAMSSTLSVSGQTNLSGLTDNGLFTNNGIVQINGPLSATGNTTLASLTTNGTLLSNGNLIVTGFSDLRGPIKNSTGPIALQGNATLTGSLTSPATGHSLGTFGTDGNVLTINGAIGGTGTELNDFGDANISGNLVIGGTSQLQSTTVTTLNAGNVFTSILGGPGDSGAIILGTGINAGVAGVAKTITGGVFTSYTLTNGTLSTGSVLTNLGTINSGKITNATISGSTLDNTPIGSNSPTTGAFSTLTSSGNTTIGTGANTINTFGSGASSNTAIGSGLSSITTIGGGSGTQNNFGTGVGATNNFGNPTGTNSFAGLINVGSLNSNGQKLIVNGSVTPGFPAGSDFELTINGDEQVTGTLEASTGGFNLITTATQGFSNVTFNRGIILGGTSGQNNLQVGGTTSLTGLLSSNGGILDNGTLTQNGPVVLALPLTVPGLINNGLLTQQGAASFNSTIFANGSLFANGPSLFRAPLTDSSTLAVAGATSLYGGLTNYGTLTQLGTANFSAWVTFNGFQNDGPFLQQNIAIFTDTVFNHSVLEQGGLSYFASLATMHGILDTGAIRQVGTSDFYGRTTFTGTTLQVGFDTIKADNTSIPALAVIGTANPSTYAQTIYTAGQNGLSVQCGVQSGTSLDNTTHFVDFVDKDGRNRGSIQGQDRNDWNNDPTNMANYILEAGTIISNVAFIGIAASLYIEAAADAATAGLPTESPTAVASAAGLVSAALGISTMAVQTALNIAQYGAVTGIQISNLGVSYQSSSGDYAEYLRRADPAEKLYAGDIVGVFNGEISKKTTGAQNVFSISRSPIVLGNVPQTGQEEKYNKVGFLGQVPVKVRGIVHPGDFIIPSGLEDGSGVAVSPDSITAKQFAMVVGRAWTGSFLRRLKYVKVAVGLNAKAMSDVASRQQDEIDALKQQVSELKKQGDDVAAMKVKLERLEQLLVEPKNVTKAIMLRNN